MAGPTSIDVREVSDLFRALGDETRLRIVSLLSHGELCVCHLVEALELPQSTVSRQLGVLRAAGVVDNRRKGAWVYYSLAEQESATRKRQLRSLAREYGARQDVRAGVARLLEAQGPDACR